MSNKTLAISVGAILVVFFGSIFAYNKYQQKNTDEYSINSQTEQQPSKEETKPAENNPKQEQAAAAPEQTAVQPGECKKDFDANKLKNTKVDIKNRTVEINVKNFGKITLNFFDQDAPKTVENFLRLADSGYYDCITFHRVAKGFVIQGGDPTGTGAGGESAFGGEFADEIKTDSALYKDGYKHGYLAMANRGPNTNTSQFFIMLGDVPLSPNYTIFGKVVGGLDVVDKIGKVEITPQMGPEDGAPKQPVVMETVKIVK
jgi:cyclophilin family peptidyl-prolyl cis-trans isomerase